MSSQVSWQCLSLKELFSLWNWQGEPEAYEIRRLGESHPITPSPDHPTSPPLFGQASWQCLSVSEFFGLCSWQGQTLENPNKQQQDPSSRLKQQVRKFFQFIPWEGTPEIGSLPKVSSIPEPIPANPLETKLTDLGDLF